MAAGSLTVRTWRYCVECSGGVTGNRWSSRSSFNQSAHVIDVKLQLAPLGPAGRWPVDSGNAMLGTRTCTSTRA